MPTIRIEDQVRVTEFDGELLRTPDDKPVQVFTPGALRWVEMEIYKLDDGSGFVLHRVGYSRVYHDLEATRCVTEGGEPQGSPVAAKDLPKDAVDCMRCSPIIKEDLYPDEKVRFEVPRHTIHRDNAAGIVEKLTTFKPRNGVRTVRTSYPVSQLLALAAEAHPDFDFKPVERIS
jgi:hypothetical protein